MTNRVFMPAILATVMVASSANAMFISNHASWKQMTLESQSAYVAGAMDSWTRTSAPGEQEWLQPQRTGINACIRAQQIHAGLLVELVNDHYRAYPADWLVPPTSVLKDVVMATCLADVNKERAKVGLEPWQRKSGQISKDN